MTYVLSSFFTRLAAIVSRPIKAAALTVAVLATASSAWAVPEVQRVVSPGGIEAWLMRLDDVPLVTFRFGFRGGALQDPEGKYGTAHMAAYLFNEGAGPHDAPELHQRLALIGAQLWASNGTEYFTVSFATPAAHKDEAFELLRLALHAPRFDEEPIGRTRGLYLSNVEAALKQPNNIASQALNRRLFGTHRMADWNDGTLEGLRSIDRADLEAYRRRVLARDNFKVAVVGHIDARTLAPLLDQLFGSLPAKAELRPVPAPAAATSGACQVVTMDVPQAVVRFGALTPHLTWKQQLARGILETILSEGHGSTTRLFRELREKRGLVYGITTAQTNYDAFGVFSGSFGTEVGKVQEAMALTRDELRLMVEQGPTEEEVATVKRAAVGGLLLGLDTGAALANLVLNMQVQRRPITYLGDLAGEIERITRQDVWDVAKLLLNPDRLAVTIVGAPTQAKLCDALAAQRE